MTPESANVQPVASAAKDLQREVVTGSGLPAPTPSAVPGSKPLPVVKPGGWERLKEPVQRRVAVAVGGAIGTGMRVAVAAVFPHDGWPWATFIENVSGAFLLGFLLTRLLAARATSVAIPLFCTGLLGSYTTFSTFVLEIVRLGDSGVEVAATYAVASVALGLLGALAGTRLGERTS